VHSEEIKSLCIRDILGGFGIRYNPAVCSQASLQGSLDRIAWFNNGVFTPQKSLQN
jgi:hypothetical protein